MPRRSARLTSDVIFHVLNRAVRRARLFEDGADYQAFLRVLAETQHGIPLRTLAYCVMPNHFHLVVWPGSDTQLARFMHRLTLTHSKRWHGSRGTIGEGPLYQGRYKAFPVQGDRHFLAVCRYVERNALRARLVEAAESWPWSSLSQRCRNSNVIDLHAWPIPIPLDWCQRVNAAESEAELTALRKRVRISEPYGDEAWCDAIRNRV